MFTREYLLLRPWEPNKLMYGIYIRLHAFALINYIIEFTQTHRLNVEKAIPNSTKLKAFLVFSERKFTK